MSSFFFAREEKEKKISTKKKRNAASARCLLGIAAYGCSSRAFSCSGPFNTGKLNIPFFNLEAGGGYEEGGTFVVY